MRYRWMLILGFLLLVILLVQQCHTAPKPKTAPYFLNLEDSVGYMGIQTCKQCHEDHYETFIQTGMGQSFGPANRLRSKADFTNVKPIYDAKINMYYVPFWQGDKLKILEFRLKNNDTIYKRIETIEYIIGSGHHTNSHMWMDNGYLFQAPLTFYTQNKEWNLPPGFETVNTRFSRKIDIECMSCHNGMPELQEGSINKFTKLPSGIDCERCHGPGELHAAEKKKGHLVDVKKEADRTIVNPARLPWKLQVDVCQRCHLQGNNVLKPGKKFTDFRPGMHLDSVFEIYMPKYENSNYFVMAGHAERLQMSACFKKSNQKNIEKYNPGLNLTCITCHNPHVSVKQTNVAKFNAACISCHSSQGNAQLKDCKIPLARREMAANKCVKCHMAPNNTQDIPHVTVHDHYIRRPDSLNANKSKGKPTGIYAVNNPSPNTNTQFRALVTWYEKFNPDEIFIAKANALRVNIEDPYLNIHYFYAHHEYAQVVKWVEKVSEEKADAWTCYRIAKSWDQIGEKRKAVNWYRLAATKEALNVDFTAEYANILLRLEEAGSAKEILLRAVKEQPKHELILINLGVAEVILNNPSSARILFLKAIALNPDNESIHLYLAELYAKDGKQKLAIDELNEALRINPKNKKAEELKLSLLHSR